MIEILRRGAPKGVLVGSTTRRRTTHEGNLGAGFRFLESAPLKRLLIRSPVARLVVLPSILLLALRCPNALDGLCSPDPRRVLGVVGVGGILDVLLCMLPVRLRGLPTAVVGWEMADAKVEERGASEVCAIATA